MELVRGHGIGFTYPTAVDAILDKVSFSITTNSKTGLIGDNGCGKSTLLGLLTGNLKPSSGSLWMAEGITLGSVEQEVGLNSDATVMEFLWGARPDLWSHRERFETADATSPEYASIVSDYYAVGGDRFEAETARVIDGFSIGEDKFNLALSELSGGEKTKVALARLLLARPDILLLDEPTNHLEIESLFWLEDFLAGITIPYIVVSHDRRFLDASTTEIWEIRNGALTSFSGNYSAFREFREKEISRQFSEYRHQQDKIKRLKEAAIKRRQAAQRMDRFKFDRAITKKGRICKRDEGSGKSVRNPGKKMDSAMAIDRRIKQLIERDKKEKPRLDRERRISFSAPELKNKFVLRIENLSRSFGDALILEDVNLDVPTGAALGIIGRNGSGKSTLVNIITGNDDDYRGSYQWAPQADWGYYSQEHEQLDSDKSILDTVLGERIAEQADARTILGRLNIRRDKVYQSIASLSLGERAKTALAAILFSRINVLVLDEPTNHLELSAREAFEDALAEYTGTLILVSHDRYLLEKVTTSIYDIERNILYPGGYGEYMLSMES